MVDGDAGEASDAELLAQSRADPARFAVVFDRHFLTIHRYIARRIGSDGADDLAGDVFRIAFERRDSFDPRWTCARPWLYGIATNVLRGERRSEERRLRALQRAASSAHVSTVDESDRTSERIDASAYTEEIGVALAQTRPGDRDALILFAVEGLAYAEVATALAIPIGTVRSRISRARSRLRELLGPVEQQHRHRPDAEDTRDG